MVKQSPARQRRRKRIKLRSNDFWGARSGSRHKVTGERIFLIKRGGSGNSGNNGPSGYKARKKWRPYANPKLQRLSLKVGPRP